MPSLLSLNTQPKLQDPPKNLVFIPNNCPLISPEISPFLVIFKTEFFRGIDVQTSIIFLILISNDERTKRTPA